MVEPDDVLEAGTVLQQLAGLPAAVVDLLVTASVIGFEGDLATLAAAHGADTADVVDLLDAARMLQLIDLDAGRSCERRSGAMARCGNLPMPSASSSSPTLAAFATSASS